MCDILSQNQIDSLLEVTDEDEEQNDYQYTTKYIDDKEIFLYDFKRPSKVTIEELRSIKYIHDKMTRELSFDISTLTRNVVEIQLHSVDQMAYGEFLMSLPSPTNFNRVSVKELNGDMILEINPSILYPLINILIGGTAEKENRTYREFTNLELKILDYILEPILKNIKNGWSEYKDLNFKIEEKLPSPNSSSK